MPWRIIQIQWRHSAIPFYGVSNHLIICDCGSMTSIYEIAYRGVFSYPEVAELIVGPVREFIETLVHRYDETVRLPEASSRTR